jgi:hypothetical protein
MSVAIHRARPIAKTTPWFGLPEPERKTVSLTIEQASAKHTASGRLPTTDFVALGFLLPDSRICFSVAFQISQIASGIRGAGVHRHLSC